MHPCTTCDSPSLSLSLSVSCSCFSVHLVYNALVAEFRNDLVHLRRQLFTLLRQTGLVLAEKG